MEYSAKSHGHSRPLRHPAAPAVVADPVYFQTVKANQPRTNASPARTTTRILKPGRGRRPEGEDGSCPMDGDPSMGAPPPDCLLYTSDAADDLLCVDLGGR